MTPSEELKIFTGNSNPALAEEIAGHLGLPLGKMLVAAFSDGETKVQIQENIRGRDVFVIQSTCPPVNQNLMELLVILDAARRASADRITAVLPYYGYARQDRKDRPRVPITAKLVANLLSSAGADRILTVDLHADQIQGYFDIPVDHLYALPVVIEHLRNGLEDAVIVSPDPGGVERATSYARHLGGLPLAIMDKRRPKPNVAEIHNIVGEVEGKDAVIVDDMIDTAGTLCAVARTLVETGGVRRVRAVATHAVLSGEAAARIDDSPLDEVIVTNTIPLERGTKPKRKKLTCLSVAGLLAETIRRIHEGESVSSLFV